MNKRLVARCLCLIVFLSWLGVVVVWAQGVPAVRWTHLSSANQQIPIPLDFFQQTASLVLDVDQDGDNDFVIGDRGASTALVWYRRDDAGWQMYLIEDEPLKIEAGGASHDIDGDGDLDIVMGGDGTVSEMWWWENPFPDYDPAIAWVRRTIKSTGARMHHDQVFSDVDADGVAELVFWNQGASSLFVAEIPADSRAVGDWAATPILRLYGEGLASGDINHDGWVDLVAGGFWLTYRSDAMFDSYAFAPDQAQSRVAIGDLRAGGNLEVVLVPGDGVGRLVWYECLGDPILDPACWVRHELLDEDVDHGHSLAIEDVDGDGCLDIFVAEMRLNGENPDARMWLFWGNGEGQFTPALIEQGYGNHESRLADLDGDGDLDILGKPYNWDVPRLDIWLNEGDPGAGLSLDRWQRHVVDPERPWLSLFVLSGDMNGDGRPDIATGGWWYENPGIPDGDWPRHPFGEPFYNLAALHDFDGDGDVDALGTTGQIYSSSFVWARNDQDGQFTILQNIDPGQGDFLQGVAVARLVDPGPLQVLLSWHEPQRGVQRLSVPGDPAGLQWPLDLLSEISQSEALDVGDIDHDGDLDLLLGTRWLQNEGAAWQGYKLREPPGDPDRSQLVDINRDGRLDAVVGFEAVGEPGDLVWFEQGEIPTELWTEHLIAAIIGPMSVDVADMDADGDLDVVAGEHNLADPAQARLFVFENTDGLGGDWLAHVVYVGDEHHDGAQVVDLDGDGDLDIVSIGWSHGQVLMYENEAID